jgi:LCP family protein required for cell wall assembly
MSVTKRRVLRAVAVSLAAAFVLVAAMAVGGILVLNHLASDIHRTPVAFGKLAAAARPAGQGGHPAGAVLITGDGIGAAGSLTSGAPGGGLILLLRVGAGQSADGVVLIPPRVELAVPGHGELQAQRVEPAGGPTLLVRTLERLAGVPIERYASIDLGRMPGLVGAVGGVDLTLPRASTGPGHSFRAGLNHLCGGAALAYLRQPSLPEMGRVLREQSLIRALLGTIAADRRLLTSPATAYRVLRALTAALTVDSGFTSAGLTSLESELRGLGDGAATFVTLPVQAASANAASANAGPVDAGAPHAGRVRAGSPPADPVHADPVHADPVHADPVHADPVHAGPVHADGRRLYPDPGLSRRLWQAFRRGTLAAFARGNPGTVTPAEVP